MYVTVEEIIMEYQLTPHEFGFKDPETCDTLLESLVEKWIIQSMSAIDRYLQLSTSYPDGSVPGLVSLACTECVGNILMNRRIRQDGAYIKSDDWTRTVAPFDILDGVREILDPLTRKNQRHNLARVQVYAVTGHEDEEEHRLYEEE